VFLLDARANEVKCIAYSLDEYLADESSAGDDVVKYNTANTSRIDQAYQELMGD